MTDIDTEDQSALLDEFLNGGFRKSLGLDLEDLRIGLTVANTAMRRGDHEQALRYYLALVLCEPSDIDFQVGLANCALEVGEAAVALQAASYVIGARPSDPRGYLLSGRACLALGAFDEAREDLMDAVRHGEASRQAPVAEQARAYLAALPVTH